MSPNPWDLQLYHLNIIPHVSEFHIEDIKPSVHVHHHFCCLVQPLQHLQEKKTEEAWLVSIRITIIWTLLQPFFLSKAKKTITSIVSNKNRNLEEERKRDNQIDSYKRVLNPWEGSYRRLKTKGEVEGEGGQGEKDWKLHPPPILHFLK